MTGQDIRLIRCESRLSGFSMPLLKRLVISLEVYGDRQDLSGWVFDVFVNWTVRLRSFDAATRPFRWLSGHNKLVEALHVR